MQQPMAQPDQLGNQQQLTQQMVLCPVRVVYETQILIPPGEQIQPNQTIFINPQNPPPWVQNRVQNQVLYVQQMPNMVAPIQQNIDQNQMYLQQNYTYQIPQMLNQERSIQIQNNFQNIGTNIAANPNDRVYMANIGQMQNQIKPQNVQMISNQVDMQRYIRPQINQNYRPQVMINSTQNIQNMPQIPNAQVTTAANIPNINIVQNIPITSAQIPCPEAPRPVQNKDTNTTVHNNVIAPNIPVSVPNRPPAPQTKTRNIYEPVNNIAPRPQQLYRPIQPRPQYRPNNIQTVNPVQNMYYKQPNQVQYISNNRKRKSESPDESKKKFVAFESNVQAPNIINIKTSHEIGVNTSPVHKADDRMQNVPKIINVSQKNDRNSPLSNIELIKNLTANTSMSIEKVDNDKLVRNTVFTQARGRLLNDKEIKANEVNNEQTNTLPHAIIREIPINAQCTHNDYMKQNTVHNDNLVITLITDKSMLNETQCNSKTENIIKTDSNETKDTSNEVLENTDIQIKTEMNEKAPISIQNEINNKLNNSIITADVKVNTIKEDKGINDRNSIIDNVKNTETTIKLNKEINKDNNVNNQNTLKEKRNNVTNKELNAKIGKKDVKLKVCKVKLNANELQLNKANGAKMEPNKQLKEGSDAKSKVNDENEDVLDKIVFKREVYDQDVLTHVLDGYVIQESSVAFPIRKPTKEKFNHHETDKQTVKKETNPPIDLPLLPFYYMHLNNDAVKEEKQRKESIVEKSQENVLEVSRENANVKEGKDHPFSKLQQNTVKTWTVDDLTKHLYSQDWGETASIFQEHEIDGESLFLVSKSQLLHIGISEEHSDVICEFIRS